MYSSQEFEIFCHFCGIGKKTVRAHTFEEAKKIVEEDESIQFDEIIRLTKPCWIDETISRNPDESKHRSQHTFDYRNWGAE